MDVLEARRRHLYSTATCGLLGEDHEEVSEDTILSSPVVRTPAPGRLRLPFEARKRESHILTDQEMEKILAREASMIPLPSTPSVHKRFSLRRSSSPAQSTRFNTGGYGRPISADWSTIPRGRDSEDFVARMRGDRRNYRASSYSGLPRVESSLRALPRVPTKNDQFIYPSSPSTTQNQPVISHDGVLPHVLTAEPTAVVRSSLSPDRLPPRTKHRRNLSAAVMDNLRKFVLKKPVDASLTPPQYQVQQDNAHGYSKKGRHASMDSQSSTMHSARSRNSSLHSKADTITPIAEAPHRMPRNLALSAHPPNEAPTSTFNDVNTTTRPVSVSPYLESKPGNKLGHRVAKSTDVPASMNPFKRNSAGSTKELQDTIVRQGTQIAELSEQKSMLLEQLGELRREVRLLQIQSRQTKRESVYTEGWVDED